MRTSTTLLFSGAALLAGFALGRISSPEPASVQQSQPQKQKVVSVAKPEVKTSASAPAQLRSITEQFDPTARQRSLAELGASLGATNPKEGWALLASIPGLADRQAFAEALIKAWARHDLAGAIASCETLAAGELRATTLAQATAIWAQQAPKDAAAYSATKLIGSARRSAVASVVQEWSRQDASAAAAWCLSQPEQVRTAALPEVMRYWANTDPKAATQWAETLAPEVRQSALESIVTEWADQYPAEAAAWLTAHPEASELAEITAQTWASSDPLAASNWALQANRTEALVPVLATWGAADPAAAHDWLAKSPPTPNHDELQQIILETWALEDAPAALAKLPSIADVERRKNVRRSLLNDWQTRAPAEAARWEQQHPQR